MHIRCEQTGRFVKEDIFTDVVGDIEKHGIYQITNTENGKIYIGGTNSAGGFRRRRQKHIWFLNNGTHINKRLQKDRDISGQSSFDFSILEYCYNGDDVEGIEKEYLDKYIDRENDYNIIGGNSRLVCTKDDCLEIIKLYIEKETTRQELANMYETTVQTIGKIITGKYKFTKGMDLSKCREKGKIISEQKRIECNKKKMKLTIEEAGKAKRLSKYGKEKPMKGLHTRTAKYFGINSGTLSQMVKGRNYKEAIDIPCPELIEEIMMK